jgi:hypothetical protein
MSLCAVTSTVVERSHFEKQVIIQQTSVLISEISPFQPTATNRNDKFLSSRAERSGVEIYVPIGVFISQIGTDLIALHKIIILRFLHALRLVEMTAFCFYRL